MSTFLSGIRLRRGRLCGVGAAVLVAAGVLGCVWFRDAQQQRAIDALVLHGATVSAQYGRYAYVSPGHIGGFTYYRGRPDTGYIVVDAPPEYLARVFSYVGRDVGARVTGIAVNKESFSDADVDLLLEFPAIRELDLSGTGITDVSLSRIAELRQLVKLDLSHTKVTRQGTRTLGKCKTLRELDLAGTDGNMQVVEELRTQLPDCLLFRGGEIGNR